MSSPATHAFATPHAALAALVERLHPVSTETVSLADASGRVLAESLRADRESPACDVSAMDGYALRVADAARASVPIAGEVRIGRPAPALPPGAALKLYTGCAIPAGAEVVLPREYVREREGEIEIVERPAALAAGWHIRRRGENAAAGSEVAVAGSLVTPGVAGGLAAFGVAAPHVYRRVRIGLLTTGDELVGQAESPQPWQIRDSNLVSLAAILRQRQWIDVVDARQLPDDEAALRAALGELLERCDAVLLSGGVSVGTYDFVPDAVRELGGRVIFHRLPIRPGKPMLGGIGPKGQAIFGLPGNPVSTAVTARRFAMNALRKLAGLASIEMAAPVVALRDDGAKIDLWWFRLVRLGATGEAELVSTRSSGDVIALAASSGFIEVPPGKTGSGPWPYYAWEDVA